MKKITSKNIVAILLTLLISFSAFSVTAFAADSLPSDEGGTLSIHKYQGPDYKDKTGLTDELTGTVADAPATGTPLGGAKFTIYQVNNVNASTDIISNYDTDSKVIEALNNNKLTEKETVTTDMDGLATYSYTGIGLYLVVETSAPNIVEGKAANFLVNLPMTNQNTDTAGTEWIYDVHVYPKNYTPLGAVVLTKQDSSKTPVAKLEGAVFSLSKEISKDNWESVTTDYYGNTINLTTNSNGIIVVNNLLKGTYKFVETKAPNGYSLNTTPVEFEIVEAGVADAATGATTSGTVVSKIKENSGEPQVNKYVTFEGNKHDTTDYTNAKTWIVKADVPADISNFSKYILTDTLSYKLTTDIATLNVYGVKGTTETKLTKDTDYKLDFTAASGTTDGKLIITFISKEFAGKALFDDTAAGKPAKYDSIKFTIDSKINSYAEMGEAIDNGVTFSYDNNSGTDKDIDAPDKPEIHTGGFIIKKIDAKDSTPLKDVEFSLFASADDAKNNTNAIATKLKTNADGIIEYKGLAYGTSANADNKTNGTNESTGSTTYYLLETKAKNGYQLSTKVWEVVVSANSFTTNTITLTVPNVKQPSLPLTGGVGTYTFLAGGVALIAVGGLLYFKSRKKSSK